MSTGSPMLPRSAQRAIRRVGPCAALLILLGTLPTPAFPCSCSPPSIPNAIERADAIFSGQVVSIDLMDESFGWYGARVELRVFRGWKGRSGSRAVVFTEPSSAACGFPFRVGERYLVFARRVGEDRRLGTGLCSRTARLGEAGEELAYLGRGERPRGTEKEPSPGFKIETASESRRRLLIGGAVGVVLGVGLTLGAGRLRSVWAGRDDR